MIKSQFGHKHQHTIVWSGTDTQIHINGEVSTEDMRHLMKMLEMAIEARQVHLEETTQLDPQTNT